MRPVAVPACSWCGLPPNEHPDNDLCEAAASAAERLLRAWEADAAAAAALGRLYGRERRALARVAVQWRYAERARDPAP